MYQSKFLSTSSLLGAMQREPSEFIPLIIIFSRARELSTPYSYWAILLFDCGNKTSFKAKGRFVFALHLALPLSLDAQQGPRLPPPPSGTLWIRRRESFPPAFPSATQASPFRRNYLWQENFIPTSIAHLISSYLFPSISLFIAIFLASA